jgi:hypothetical protein
MMLLSSRTRRLISHELDGGDEGRGGECISRVLFCMHSDGVCFHHLRDVVNMAWHGEVFGFDTEHMIPGDALERPQIGKLCITMNQINSLLTDVCLSLDVFGTLLIE